MSWSVAPLAVASVLLVAGAAGARAQVVPYEVVGDGIPAALAGAVGEPARGRAIVADRQQGLCLLCHAGPFPEERLTGTIATDLSGAGARWSVAQLRLRVVDARRLDPDSPMPAFHRVDGRVQVAPTWQGRPLLSAQQVEDVVAFLATLKP